MGFEVVVRPAVFPNIRPAPAQSLPPQDDPEKGFATINGNGAKEVTLSKSYNASASSSQREETKRKVDVARIYQKNDDETVNKDNFVDVEVATKIWMDTGTTEPGMAGTERKEVYKYEPVKERDNIEIRKRDVIRQSGTTAPGYAGTD